MNKRKQVKTTTTYRPLFMFVLFTLLALGVIFLNSVSTDGSAVGKNRVHDAAPAVSGAAPLLVFDPAAQRMALRISNRTVWQAEYHLGDAGSKNAAGFFQQFFASGDTETPIVESCHLYSGYGQYSDRELTAVADEIGVQPVMLQRIFPGRLVISFSGGCVLEITTGTNAPPLSRLDNFCIDVLRFVGAPFAERCLRISMDAADALTLQYLARETSRR